MNDRFIAYADKSGRVVVVITGLSVEKVGGCPLKTDFLRVYTFRTGSYGSENSQNRRSGHFFNRQGRYRSQK